MPSVVPYIHVVSGTSHLSTDCRTPRTRNFGYLRGRHVCRVFEFDEIATSISTFEARINNAQKNKV